MRSSDRELNKYIKECAHYLYSRKKVFTVEQIVTTNGITKKQSRSIEPFNKGDANSALQRLGSMAAHLSKAGEEAFLLMKRETTGREHAAGLRLTIEARRAYDNIFAARMACASAIQDIKLEIEHNVPRGNEHPERKYQLSACRLAIAYFQNPENRGGRGVAKEIMEAANISEPEKTKLSSLIKEARET